MVAGRATRKPPTKQENFCVGRKSASAWIPLEKLHVCFWSFPKTGRLLSSPGRSSWAWVTGGDWRLLQKPRLWPLRVQTPPAPWESCLLSSVWRFDSPWDPCKLNHGGRGKIRNRCDHRNLKNKTKENKQFSPLANTNRAQASFLYGVWLPGTSTRSAQWVSSAQKRSGSLPCFLWRYMFLEQPFWFENVSGWRPLPRSLKDRFFKMWISQQYIYQFFFKVHLTWNFP